MSFEISRRRVLGMGTIGAGASLAGCGVLMSEGSSKLQPPLPSPGPVTMRIGRGMKLHMFQTGWVAVKQEHRAFNGPAVLRLPAILASRTWTEWMPITAFVIEHPEGMIVVDKGETARSTELGYAACDAITGMFYRNNLRFALQSSDEIGPQMERAGLAPERVTRVVMTHLHSDHMGGMGWFPKAEFLISEVASRGHTGALMCRIPADLNISPVRSDEISVGVFSHSTPLTRDGAVSIVPTPGHANGHQSVLIQSDGRSICLVGDAVFTLEQAMIDEVGGIVESVADALRTSRLLKAQVQEFRTLLLPAHDAGNAARMAQGW